MQNDQIIKKNTNIKLLKKEKLTVLLKIGFSSINKVRVKFIFCESWMNKMLLQDMLVCSEAREFRHQLLMRRCVR